MENIESNVREIWDLGKKCNILYNWNFRSSGKRKYGRSII